MVITDELDDDLDLSTFALTEIGFGDLVLTVPAGSQYFETAVPMTYNSQTFDVRIEAGIDLLTRKIYAHFYSIDPATDLPPDVLTGFLPPEDGTGRGMGHVSYTILPKLGLPTGTEIRNVALISFDRQPWIATNQIDPHDPSQGTDPDLECPNTIDANIPASQVLALPSQSSPNFVVSWDGEDDPGGSGVAHYDVYYRVDGGSDQLWLDDTTQISAVCSG